MLYRFLISKKGFTLVELMAVVLILSILTAVAVPIFTVNLKKRKQDECYNQRTVIETMVKQAMFGMIDNGKKQEKIYFEDLQSDHYCKYPGDGVDGNADDVYKNKACFVLWYEKINSTNQVVVTLGDLRGGYRDTNTYKEYRDGCNYDEKTNPNGARNYLKKQRLADNSLYAYLENGEIPVCPFADEKYLEEKTNPEYLYYILEDGSVICSCPECNEID